MKLKKKNLFVSVVDEKRIQSFATEEIEYNQEIALFMLPEALQNPRPYVETIKAVLQRYPVRCSLHGPVDLPYYSSDPLVQDVARQRFQTTVDAASKIGAEYMVVHSMYNPYLPHPKFFEKWLEPSVQFWTQLADYAAQRKVCIAVENILDDTPAWIGALIGRVGSPYLKACLDMGHAYLLSKRPLEEWIYAWGKDLVYIHAHDNRGKIDDHIGLGEGTIPLGPFFKTLEASPADPIFSIEVKTQADAEISLAYLRTHHLLSD